MRLYLVRRTVRYRHQLSHGERRQVAVQFDIGKLVSKEVVGNQMRVVGESLSLSSARRECGLVAGDQSAARLARVIIGHVGGNVHTVAVAREMVVYSLHNSYPIKCHSAGQPKWTCTLFILLSTSSYAAG